ncbi:TPA: O75 family O-antigen flippase, partial [Escherichia coli]
DYLLVSKFLTLSYVTIFGSYMMVFQIVTVLMSSFVNAITAGMGNYLINKSNLEIKEITRQFYVIFIAFATFISLNMFFLVNDFIAKWIGVNYTLSNTLVALMIVNVFISVVRVPSDILKNASGHFGDIYYPLLEGVLNITISIILAIIIGLPGIIIGTIVSNLIVIMLAKPLYLYSKLFNLRNPTRVYFEFISRPMLYSLCVIGVSYLLRDEIYSFKVSTWLDFINKLLLVSTPSILVICAIFSTDSDFR